MNAEQILDALGSVKEDYVEEAAAHAQRRKSPVWMHWGAMAACLCLCTLGILRLWNPGMGKDSPISSLAVKDGNLYYSVASKGGYYWNENTKRPKRLSKGDTFAEISNGLFFVSIQKDAIYQVEGTQLIKIGVAGVKEILTNPNLIGIKDGFAYWKGEGADEADDRFDGRIVRTNLQTGEAETLISRAGTISAQAMQGDTLYYEAQADGDENHQVAAYNVSEHHKTILYEFPEPKPGETVLNRAYFTEEAVILLRQGGLYKLSYEGGAPEFLTEQIPITAAFDSQDGKIYFETAFHINRPQNEGEGIRESLVSVELETGKLQELVQLTKNSVAEYTYTKLCVAENGYYFTDPQKGLFYHSFENGTDIQITKE